MVTSPVKSFFASTLLETGVECTRATWNGTSGTKWWRKYTARFEVKTTKGVWTVIRGATTLQRECDLSAKVKLSILFIYRFHCSSYIPLPHTTYFISYSLSYTSHILLCISNSLILYSSSMRNYHLNFWLPQTGFFLRLNRIFISISSDYNIKILWLVVSVYKKKLPPKMSASVSNLKDKHNFTSVEGGPMGLTRDKSVAQGRNCTTERLGAEWAPCFVYCLSWSPVRQYRDSPGSS